LPNDAHVSHVSVNGKTPHLTQTGRYVEVQVHFDGDCFGHAQEVARTSTSDGALEGNFTVPQRIFDQLEARKKAWPIPWTKEDYESTCLAPERLLLFLQAADATDAATVTATLDDKPLAFQPAYSAGPVDSPTFVGFYADLSRNAPGPRHTIRLRVSGIDPAQLQGAFFDNVEPELTESILPWSGARNTRRICCFGVLNQAAAEAGRAQQIKP